MPDIVHAVDSLSYFFAPSEPIELRFLGVERPHCTHAGWLTTDDIDRTRNVIDFMSRISNGVYFTPQLLSPDMLSRPRCHFGIVRKDKKTGEIRPQLTTDADVLQRRYLIIDIDPVKPEGHRHESATDEEKHHANSVANNVRAWLHDRGWLPPLVVDSGNGFHCYYRLATPAVGGKIDRPDLDPLAKLLRLLARLHNTPYATIDTTVYNPARIMKLPGTMAKKGANSTSRPHRVSRLLEVPETWFATAAYSLGLAAST